ncbi:hypothetical protein [Streptomyces californicus]|uniref:hypothetical protein n=1 Tax=Streptomyces californicus TaxID=67351 RepID=UPI0037A4CC14
MRALRSPHGTRSKTLYRNCRLTFIAAHTGYRFECLTSPLVPGAPGNLRVLRTYLSAREAIRAMRIQVRTFHMAGLNPREIAHALNWTDNGCVQAVAALDRGEPCSLSLITAHGELIEWHIRPINLLAVVESSEGVAARRPTPLPELSA